MRIGRSLTIWCSLLQGGGGAGPGGLFWGVPGLVGGCLVREVSALGGSAPRGGLPPGGVSAVGGLSAPRGASQHALRQTPLPPVDRHTLVKVLPWPNFVVAGNKIF